MNGHFSEVIDPSHRSFQSRGPKEARLNMIFDWENIGDVITEGTRLLNHYNICSPRQDLEILLCEICKMERSHLLTQRERKLSTEESHQIYTAIKRRTPWGVGRLYTRLQVFL